MTQVLMSPTNPDGWKLEDLLEQLRKEIAGKSDKIRNDERDHAQRVFQNNGAILQLLEAAERLQRDSIATLDAVAKNNGPTGTPRIGLGSPGYEEKPDPLGR